MCTSFLKGKVLQTVQKCLRASLWLARCCQLQASRWASGRSQKVHTSILSSPVWSAVTCSASCSRCSGSCALKKSMETPCAGCRVTNPQPSGQDRLIPRTFRDLATIFFLCARNTWASSW